MASEIARQYENYSVYVILRLRGANPGFHWGIFMPTNTPDGYFWHAVNRSGGWELEVEQSDSVPSSMGLCVAYKVGTIKPSDLPLLDQTLRSVPAQGQPSRITGEDFTCRIYVKDSLHHLHTAGTVSLSETIGEMERTLNQMGEEHRHHIERGTQSARVVN